MVRSRCSRDRYPDPTSTGGKDAKRAKALELAGWDYPKHLAGRAYAGKHGEQVTADRAAAGTQASEFDAVVIPGGFAPDKMRLRHPMVDLVRDLMAAGKPVAAICHGPQVLINANVLRGRTLTCWPSIAVDVKNAGGHYVDKPVVEDGNLITSRKPDDLTQFTDALVRQLTDPT